MTGKRHESLHDLKYGDPVFVHAEHPLSEAGIRFRDAGAKILIVLDGEEVVGTLSAAEMAGEAARKRDAETELVVRDVMDHRVPQCRVDCTMEEAARILAEEEARALLLVDAHDRVCGVVSLKEIEKAAPEAEVRSLLARAESEAWDTVPEKSDPTGGYRREDGEGTPPSYSDRPHVRKKR